MIIAVQGCLHGELDALYASLELAQQQQMKKIDLVIICGDFQSIRNSMDLSSLACPQKYRDIGNFYEYYCGLKVAPIPTLFIGGNHEASNYLWELYYGGFVATNIYYMGHANVVKFGGLRIAGLSGIYKSHDYNLGYYEQQPFDESSIRSIYHIRKFNVFKLSLIKERIQICLSHDWPRGIVFHGDTKKLFKLKPFLIKDINSNQLGSPPAEMLLKKLRPDFWFSAHLHVKYAAVYHHTNNINLDLKNPDEISLGDSDEDEVNEADSGDNNLADFTKFLALDKILPNRDFLQVLEIPDIDGPMEFQFDEEWLAITKSTNQYFCLSKKQEILPEESTIKNIIEENLIWIKDKISNDPTKLKIPPFAMTAPPYGPLESLSLNAPIYSNPQTVHLCELLEMENIINPHGQKC